MICGFADYRFGFVSEVGSLTPVKGHRASCLVVSKKKKKRCEIPSVLISWSSAGSQGAGLCPSRHRRQHRVWRRANTSNKWSSMQTVKTSLIWWTLKLTCTNEAFAPSYKTICSLSTKLAAWPSESMPVDTHTPSVSSHTQEHRLLLHGAAWWYCHTAGHTGCPSLLSAAQYRLLHWSH